MSFVGKFADVRKMTSWVESGGQGLSNGLFRSVVGVLVTEMPGGSVLLCVMLV